MKDSLTGVKTIMTTKFERKPFLAAAAKADLQEFILSIGESKFRADQIYSWITKKWVCDPDSMTNLSASV